MKKTKNPFLSIAAAWAFYGIYSKQIENYPLIAYVALFCQAIIIVTGASLINFVLKK
jgi:sialic acid synthase SpsE